MLSIARGFFLLAAAALPLLSQVQSRLTGTIRDNSGAAIVGASVTTRNVATGVIQQASSNETGTYLFVALQPGMYTLLCEHSGFKRFEHSGIVLETGLTRTVDVTLELGALTESVTVRGSAPLLESENATVGQLIERVSVMNMPIDSRRGGSLIRLMGNVVYRGEANNDTSPVFSMAGGRGMNQMWQLDGGVVQNMALGNPGLLLNPPSETLQEFKADANNYSAEFGRAGGGLILMTTRSGTNQFHGAAYEFLRNDKLDARTFFAPGKAPLRYNIFGASIGGPVLRDRTHFFFNYEGSRRRDGVTISDYDVPHPAEVTGDFSARRDIAILDPVTATPFPGNRIPANRIDPVGQAFARLWPAPNISNNNITAAPRDNFISNLSDKINADFYTTRIDHIFNSNHRLFARYSYIDNPERRFGIFPVEFADPRARAVAKSQHVEAHPTREILDVVAELSIPVMYYPAMAQGSGPARYFHMIATAYPTVNFILPHLGSYRSRAWWAHIETIDLVKRYPNVYVETSGVAYHEFLEQAVRELPSEKILFGSFAPELDPRVEIHLVRLFKAKNEDKVLGGNILRLLKERN